ncbi:lipopolysaccharide biosynthesis protein [Halococcoides cellulosivorans]|uniref:Polysaccharide biosynthesis protein n=1 Tax=Halococcoides cellulosivorans TaxID=1679096 RepID=A0A2R4X027_9EURY|nr:polysaccharide biosynthesis C-terminal domain-containing protein [Halococcoides cellulosivorans]AWB27133.1 polysaccharide biosynthesis protein [Halococcoides cellulosivorans]
MATILKGFISIFGAKVSNLVLMFVITPILVRLLGSSGYGDYSFLLSLTAVSFILVNAGTFDGTRKFIAENREFANWTEYVIGYYLRVGAILAGFALIIYSLISWFGLSSFIFGPPFDLYFILVGILLLAKQYSNTSRGGLMGLSLEHQSEPLVVLRKFLFGLSAICLALLGLDVVGVLIGRIFAFTIVGTIGYILLSRHINIKYIFKKLPDDFPRKELLAFNGLSIVLIFLIFSLYHVDILLIRPLTGSDQAGFYKAALVIAQFLWFAPRALQTVLLHSSSEMWTTKGSDEVSDMISQLTRFNVTFTLLLILGLGSLAADFVPIYYGPDFQQAVLPLLLLLPGTLGFAVTRPIMAVGQGKGTLRPLIVATGAAAAINLVLNLLLIPQYGMVGAGVATSVGYGSMLVFHGIAARRIGYDPFRDLRLARIAITAGVSAPVIVGLSLAIPHSILSLVVVPPVGFVVYGVLVLRTRVIDVDELDPIVERVPEPVDAWVSRTLSIVA